MRDPLFPMDPGHSGRPNATSKQPIIRELRTGDINLIRNSWLNGFRQSMSPVVVLAGTDRRISDADSRLRGKGTVATSRRKGPITMHLSAGVSNDVFFYEQGMVIDTLLRSSAVDILCDADDENTILGWSLTDVIDGHPVIHWVYVRATDRGRGHATRLLSNRNITKGKVCFFTHAPAPSFDSEGLMCSRWKDGYARTAGWVYDPYITSFSIARALAQDIADEERKRDEDTTRDIQD